MPKELKTPIYSEQLLSDFAKKEWNKTIAFLKKNFTQMSTEDCEDVFQESFITLISNCKRGKIKEQEASLSTYFTSICFYKANDRAKAKKRKVKIATETSFERLAKPDMEKVENLISLDPDLQLRDAKEAIARQIVRDLPKPCDDLLWGFFRDGLKLQTLADMLNKTEGYVKVTKHRCQDKFRKRWSELTKNLFNLY